MSSAPTTTAPAAALAADYDLLHKMSEFLDLHMIFPLIQHSEQLKTVYKADELARTKKELLEFTHMGPHSAEQEKALAQELLQLEQAAQPVLALQRNEALLGELRTSKRFNPASLEPHGVTPASLEAFFLLGKFQYESGKYEEAAAALALFREITQTPIAAMNNEDAFAERSFDALWGKLAAEICLVVVKGKQEFAPQALLDVKELSKILDARDNNQLRPVNHLEQLQFRRWMLHWSLFAFFFQENKVGLFDFMLSDVAPRTKMTQAIAQASQEHLRNRNVLENHCPWLLRYVVAAHLVNKSRRSTHTKDLVLLVEQEAHLYSDPLCELFLVLSANFDLERATELVKKCEVVFQVDFFLARWKEELLVNIRTLIMEMHCKLSASADVFALCKQLGGTEEEAQHFAQEFVKNTKTQTAKLDLAANGGGGHRLVMAPTHIPVWQVCGDKAKDLAARSQALENGILAMQNEGTM